MEYQRATNTKNNLQHQQDLYHVFIDFKKAFSRVWQNVLWATMRMYKITARQGCLISKNNKGGVGIGGQIFIYFCFSDEMVVYVEKGKKYCYQYEYKLQDGDWS